MCVIYTFSPPLHALTLVEPPNTVPENNQQNFFPLPNLHELLEPFFYCDGSIFPGITSKEKSSMLTVCTVFFPALPFAEGLSLILCNLKYSPSPPHIPRYIHFHISFYDFLLPSLCRSKHGLYPWRSRSDVSVIYNLSADFQQ